MTLEWRCVIPGRPRQKGNAKRGFVVHRGGKARAIVVPSAVTVEAETNAKAVAYLQRPAALMLGALWCEVEFRFAIPKSRAKKLKPGDPHAQRPDRGNLLKLVEDVLQGIVYHDDCAVADGPVRKVWGERDETVIVVRTMGAAA